MNKYIGINLHSNNSVVVVTDEADRIIFSEFDDVHLQNRIRSWAPDKIIDMNHRIFAAPSF